jgi:hypothetical protein
MNKEALEKQRARRKADGNAATHKYEKTQNGFLMRVYRNMKSRVTGIQKLKAHLYVGLPIISKEEFYAWSKINLQFLSLFKQWEASGYSRLLTPSIDRIDSSKGYEIENMRGLTHSENSKEGALSKKRKLS